MAEHEQHPAFGMIGANRVTTGPTGAVLFDSDVRHHNSVIIQIHTADRNRDLSHDWIHPRKEIIEIQMSEAQWASFVSSMNTSGVPCTLRRVNGEQIEGLPYEPRLKESMRETREAADRAFAEIKEAMEAYEALPSTPAAAKKEAWRTLRAKISNATPNVAYAASKLSEHTENVVERARADVEAMVRAKADQLAFDSSDLTEPLLLGEGEES